MTLENGDKEESQTADACDDGGGVDDPLVNASDGDSEKEGGDG